MTDDYCLRIYEPMTREWYAAGGWYIETHLIDGAYVPIKRLSLDEALAFRGDRRRSVVLEDGQ